MRSRIVRYLLLHWSPKAIADEVHCGIWTVQTIRENIFIYESPFRPQTRKRGGPRKVYLAAEESLSAYIEEQSWAIGQRGGLPVRGAGYEPAGTACLQAVLSRAECP